jgi:hypothetical protein
MAKRNVAVDFKKDIQTHKMEVLLNQGLYRHLQFMKPGNSHHWFEIVTWPGVLSIRGDMGCYTFSRVQDMFIFFHQGGGIEINPHYWEEKIIAGACSTRSICKTFDADYYKANVMNHLNNYSLTSKRKKQIKKELAEAIDWEDPMCMREVAEFKSEDGFELSDPWEIDYETYTYHYLWCCHAIVWGIAQFKLLEQN